MSNELPGEANGPGFSGSHFEYQELRDDLYVLLLRLSV